MGVDFAFGWEIDLMTWIQSRLGDAGTKIMSFITMFGEELVLVALLAFIFFCIDKIPDTWRGQRWQSRSSSIL